MKIDNTLVNKLFAVTLIGCSAILSATQVHWSLAAFIIFMANGLCFRVLKSRSDYERSISKNRHR